MRIQVCINNKMIDKSPENSPFFAARYFKRKEFSIGGFITEIQKGHAFCPWFKNGKRNSANFDSANYVAIDIDNGMGFEDALEHALVKTHATFLYTTPSHQQPGKGDRFRIVFLLEEAITDATQYENLTNTLIQKLGGDGSCKDACRLFYGSKNCRVEVLNHAD